MNQAYYNEHDPFAAAWLRELIKEGHIAPGIVDKRDIQDVKPDELRPYTQVHLFAGIGGWSYALRLAGWPDDRPVWTGSCPCQPFSAAGKRQGTSDKRHLWPDMFRLVRECKPDVVFGEQVDAAVRLGWLDGVFTDLEGEGYACGSAVLGAHSVGAPHIRQRLWWVADAESVGHERCQPARGGGHGPSDGGSCCGLADTELPCAARLKQHRRSPQDESKVFPSTARGGLLGGLGDTNNAGLEGRQLSERGRASERITRSSSHWNGAISIFCGDGKTWRIEPGISPLVDGLPGRVGLLRGYGNAIVPACAAEFVMAYMEYTDD